MNVNEIILETGFTLKQLHDYLENWNGLMHRGEHLHETKKIKDMRQTVLTDACTCISILGILVNDPERNA